LDYLTNKHNRKFKVIGTGYNSGYIDKIIDASDVRTLNIEVIRRFINEEQFKKVFHQVRNMHEGSLFDLITIFIGASEAEKESLIKRKTLRDISKFIIDHSSTPKQLNSFIGKFKSCPRYDRENESAWLIEVQ
jgi:hypothetical protein